MKAVIFAGGFGTRLSEETSLRPKPMVEIGDRPILHHIMEMYAAHGITDFVVLGGYKVGFIKDYFLNFHWQKSDFTIDLATGNILWSEKQPLPWKVTVLDTGVDTMTGGRLKRAHDVIGKETFCLTYGDGVSDVDITALIEFHKNSGAKATVTAVSPPGRFGVLGLSSETDRVLAFREKDSVDVGLINGGSFVCEPDVFDLVDDDTTVWEQEPMNRLVEANALAAYRHQGFWQAMDTVRDRQVLEAAYAKGAPWLKGGNNPMKFHATSLKDAVLIDLERRGDDRGFFARTFCVDEFSAHGLPTEFVQQNMSYSAAKGTIRGMHFQHAPHAEDKLIRCLRGAIVDIILDLRPDSPTFKKWEAFELNEENKRQLLVPKGFAHGFQTVSDHVEVTYLVSAKYTPAAESGVRWNDPAFGIQWPLGPTEMSDKDKVWPDYQG